MENNKILEDGLFEKAEYGDKVDEFLEKLSGEWGKNKKGIPDEDINNILALVGKFTGVERVYLNVILPVSTEEEIDNMELVNAYEWCAEGIGEHLSKLYTPESFATGKKALKYFLKYDYLHVPDHKKIPAEMDFDFVRKQSRYFGIKSSLDLPVRAEGKLEGGFGFTSLQKEKRWSKDDIRLLKGVGEVIVKALRTKQE